MNTGGAFSRVAYEVMPRALFDLSPSPILLLDQELLIREVNPAATLMMGYSARQLVGQPLFIAVHPDEVSKLELLWRRLFDCQGQVYQETLRIRHTNGSWRIVELMAHNLLDDPAVGNVVIYLSDTTSQAMQASVGQDTELLAYTTLAAAYDATLEGWVRALDLRDKETEGHTRRVTTLAVRLARFMGIEGEELVHIRRGALLHDIGKLGIPDRILHKPGPLTNEEWLLMKRHPVYAYEWLAPISFLGSALAIPYCHHERWDGAGYPRGLKGTEIPLAARIFSIIDTWDALRSERPYKPAISSIEALALIAAQAGQQFDPAVVRAFLTMLVEEGNRK
jgi:PAS domain S-box-containing protein